ncbi:hypothetical protein [Kaistia nematophila]|uniref:Uncharacterized protein n=1 Tax=Kaistia nematophila TaxID=2994654 RepID=A0A9X3IJZ0_9HYPH|nr:hypothetical protein [Kaistia nematophila]MCX5568908.1 hypothetical protein [Kaistia nematophila]
MDRKRFDIEHALSLYALNFFTLPANALYDRSELEKYKDIINKSHIYVVGFIPVVEFISAKQDGRNLIMAFEILSKNYELLVNLPDYYDLVLIDDLWYISDGENIESLPSEDWCLLQLHLRYDVSRFHVKYIGQAYGKNGSRNALDRLSKHEKLQEIAIKGCPDGHKLQILMLVIEPSNRIITSFNPRAIESKSGDARISAGLDKLFSTNEAERISLYEAALIRYFLPQYNLEFKNSFPSTNLNILKDCYEKDFSGLVAEVNFDDMPFSLYSENVKAKPTHAAYYNLHDDRDRQIFFST